MIRLAIVDDDLTLANALKKELMEFQEISSINCYDEGTRLLDDLERQQEGQRPHLIVMDISMRLPDEGITITSLVRSRYPDIQVVMFTITDADDMIFNAFKAGAMGYLLKNEKPAFVLKTIQDVLNGGAQMSPSIARKTISFLNPIKKGENSAASGSELLSPRELEVLRQVEKGITYDKIAESLNISTHTVKKHMMNIFQKLQVKNKVSALRKAEHLF
ncbi:MAG: response regulator transcription factor [Bacteroidetes bacterium]|nr:response regulator transcription factor [Bacteroidota bacterium]